MSIAVRNEAPVAKRTRRHRIARFVRWGVSTALLQLVALIVLAWALPGFELEGARSFVLAALILSLGQALVWPAIYWVAARFHPVLFPALCFILAGLMVVLLADIAGDAGVNISVRNFWIGALIVCGSMAISTILGALFSLRDDGAYDWFVVRPLRSRYLAAPEPSATPGFIFLEIDGLAKPILERALADGWMPNLQGWIERGSHRLIGWEPDLSSQTSASQAGILLGDNSEIPAFRWYDKQAGALKVSSRMSVARELEERLSTGDGLLRGGASRWNVFSGDARDTLATFSTVGVSGYGGSGQYIAYWANPYSLSRSAALFVGDIFRERWQALRQRATGERPRIHRSVAYSVVRATTTTLMQEAGLFMVIADAYRGVPAVYVTFFAYDEVAHHSGIDRIDCFKVLERLDHAFATLERATAHAPRSYHLVVLSDHGQSMGDTFRQRYGQTLGELVSSLLDPEARVTIEQRAIEDRHYLDLLVAAAREGSAPERTSRLVWRAVDRLEHGADDEESDTGGASDVVVLASGNLGLVSFPRWDERLTFEQITDRFPALIPGLVGHDGIGFILVRSEQDGAVALSDRGAYYLRDDHVEGENPLAPYGPNAARHLRRTDGFETAPDILVMSRYDPETGEVNAFEELVGSHGGLGGPQTEPFLLHPAELDPGSEPIVGAAALHAVLKRWVTDVTEPETEQSEPPGDR